MHGCHKVALDPGLACGNKGSSYDSGSVRDVLRVGEYWKFFSQASIIVALFWGKHSDISFTKICDSNSLITWVVKTASLLGSGCSEGSSVLWLRVSIFPLCSYLPLDIFSKLVFPEILSMQLPFIFCPTMLL